MSADETRPLLAGGGQALQRDGPLEEALGPVELMAQAARAAAQDAGLGAAVFSALDAVGVVDTPAWRPRNAPRLLADALGARPPLELVTALGGESPLLLVNHLAGEIAAGRVAAALVAGSNNIRSFQRARRAGRRVQWPSDGDGAPVRLTEDRAGTSEQEQRYGLGTPAVIYPLFENALRASRGLDLETHRARMGALMQRFTRVAARNPYAWFPIERSAAELTTPTAENRMVAFPYTKYLNAVLETDQAAAVLLLSAAAARRLGLRPERAVHWWGGGSAIEEVWFPTERPSFAASAALRAATLQALSGAATTLEELTAFDLYSCFPVAVEMACEMLGLREDDPRGLTVSGGLPYFGGPGNDYALHAVVSMAARLRQEEGARGLVTGLGWYLTKHAACVLATAPRESAGPASAPPPSSTAGPPVEIRPAATGAARIETYTVTFSREGVPERGIVVGRLDDGARFLANTPSDLSMLEDLLACEGVGRSGTVTYEDERNVFHLR